MAIVDSKIHDLDSYLNRDQNVAAKGAITWLTDGNRTTVDIDAKHERFLALYGQSQRRMYTYIRSQVLSAHDADDVFQEVSTVLWKRFDEYQPDTDFTRWACIVAWTEVLAYHRHRRRLLAVLRDDLAERIGQQVLDLGETADVRLEALEHCVKKLPFHAQDFVRRRYHANRTTKQIAAEVGRTESAVYKALQRIHDSLFACIEAALARRPSR